MCCNYFEVEFTHIVLIRSVTLFGISVFRSLFTSNKFEDLNEFKLSKMIQEIKLQLMCVIEHILFFIIGIAQSRNG